MNAFTNLFDVNLLIHYHITAEEHPQKFAELTIEATKRFLDAGLIERAPNRQLGQSEFTTTRLGAALLASLINTPIPTVVFLDAAGKKINV